MWNLPFAGRNRVWCQRRLAAEFAALARSRFCGWHAYILVSCSIDGMIFYPRARLSRTDGMRRPVSERDAVRSQVIDVL
jgi:hypothetical protein